MQEYYYLAPKELEPLSQIIEEFNARFGTNFSEEDKLCIHEIEERLAVNIALEASVRVNSPENARLGFDRFVTDLAPGYGGWALQVLQAGHRRSRIR